jgi:Undecaprenyl-phosphate glucose phosphotransferase
MLKRRSQALCAWFLLSDLFLTAGCWVGAYCLRFRLGWLAVNNDAAPPEVSDCWARLPLVLVLSAVAYELTGQYAIHRLRRFREEVVAVIKGTALLALLIMATNFFTHDNYESRATMVLFFGLVASALLACRRLSWAGIRALRSQGYNQARAVIVGTGRVGRKTASALRHASFMGIRNLGYIEDQPNRWTSDLDVLGTIADLPQLVQKYQVDHVFIALPLSRYHEARRVFDILSRSLVEVRLVVDVPALGGLSLTTTNLDGLPVIGLRESPHFGLNVVVKRAMDVILSLVGLVVLSPVMLIIAALVKLTSPGPIFYRQERCGLNGKPFPMLKFRSMREDAEKSGAGWTTKDDPRRTAFGAFLRRTNLDELPQLVNVLRGDMSLVGPRPERPVYVQQFSRTIPNYMARHSVKCGLTGWAQVNGWRGNTSLRKRVQFDLYYITHWNPWLDLHILWMTVWKAWFHRNAY